VDGGPLKGLTLEAKDFPVRLGRAEDNDLVLEDLRVSRHHALIRTQGELFILEDLGSTNGTFFGGRRVGARVLDDGDRFNIGGSEILFSLA
jgi:pSer/pThr/pTyr-binding forkhead associated (FHA) protein